MWPSLILVALTGLLLGCVAPQDRAHAADACQAYLRDRVLPGQEVSFGTARSTANQDGTLTLDARFTASIHDSRIKDSRGGSERGSYRCVVRPIGDRRWHVVSLFNTPVAVPWQAGNAPERVAGARATR